MINDDRVGIVRCIARHGVRYLIVGGFAALAHGVEHVTEDIDITPADDHDNLSRLACALSELEARFRVDRYPDGFRPPAVIDAEMLKKMVSAAFVTSRGNLDVVLHVAGVGRYDALIESSQEVSLPGASGLTVLVMGLDDLVIAKQAAGRAKDLALLPALEARALERRGGAG